jgi:hypothetical protein
MCATRKHLASAPASSSDREHLLQNVQYRRQCVRADAAEPLRDPFVVNRAELVQCNKTSSILKATSDAPGIRLTTGGHRSNDYGAKMLIQLVRRYNQARTRFSNLASASRVKPDETDIATTKRLAYRHSHSPRSNLVGIGRSSS